MKKHLLVLTFFLCGFVYGQTSETPLGAGTSANPYKIKTLGNLYWIYENPSRWSKQYEQTGNIDASAVSTWNDNTGWTPIGNLQTPFTGKYDGKGYTIDKLYVNKEYDIAGLFGFTLGSVIRNLGLTNVNITGGYNTGALVGDNNGSISNCYSSGSVNGSSNDFGGPIGGLTGSNNSTLTYCYSTCSVNGKNYTGGLVGNNSGTIASSYTSGSVTGGSLEIGSLTGGLAGMNSGEITNCYSTSNVTGSANTGGLAGQNYDRGNINNSYSGGTVTGGKNSGGLAGKNFFGTITNCYSSGRVSGTSDTGGLIGNANQQNPITNCFWDKTVNPTLDNGIGTGVTTVEMKTCFTFINAGWDFLFESINGPANYWGINEVNAENNGYPFLKWQNYAHLAKPVITTQPVTDITPGSVTGNGNILFLGNPWPSEYGICWSTSENPTVDDYKTTNAAVSAGVFTSPVTGLLTHTTYYFRAYAITPLGASYGNQEVFTYNAFDGKGTETEPYLVKSLNDLKSLTDSSVYWDKSFKQIFDINVSAVKTWNSGTGWMPVGDSIKHFTGKYDGDQHIIDSLFINRESDYQGFFGYITGAAIQNVKVTNVNITGTDNTGGLAGLCDNSSISDCYISGSVSGRSSTGGLAGSGKNSEISNTISNADVYGSMNSTGGLVGWSYQSTILNCVTGGNVEGTVVTGGMVGYNEGSEITDSYSTSSVSGIWNDTGGLIGWNFNSTVLNCSTSSNVSGSRNVGGLVGNNEYVAKILFSHSSSSVSGGDNTGGLVGINMSIIDKSYSTGNVDGGSSTGGLAGHNTGEGNIMNSFSSSNVTGVSVAGGLVGQNNDWMENIALIKNCYSLGNVSADISAGGLVGASVFSDLINCYSSGIVTGSMNTGGLIGAAENCTFNQCFWNKTLNPDYDNGFGTGKTTSEMKSSYTYVGWDHELWLINEEFNNGYPYLFWQEPLGWPNSTEPGAEDNILPKEFAVMQNYPNPFNPDTKIDFHLPVAAKVTLKIYDILGNEIASLADDEKPAGRHVCYWNGRNSSGQAVASGVYLYRITAGNFTETRKMNLLK